MVFIKAKKREKEKIIKDLEEENFVAKKAMDEKSLEFRTSKSKLENKVEKLTKENIDQREKITELKCKLDLQSKMNVNIPSAFSRSNNESDTSRKEEQIKLLTKQLEMAKEIIKDRKFL